jgi:hypothetical protein
LINSQDWATARTIYSSFTAKGQLQIDQFNKNQTDSSNDTSSGQISLKILKVDISKIEIYRGDVSEYNSTYKGQVDNVPIFKSDDDDEDDDFDEGEDDEDE